MIKCNCDKTKPYIFVSYSHKDSEEVHKIIEKMYKEGYNVWFDEGIDPGTEWDEYIASHVEGASYFIACISKNYLNSSNCKDELNFARDLEKERIIVYLEDVELSKGMQMRLNRVQAIYKHKYPDVDEFYDKLLNSNELKGFKNNNLVFDKLFLEVGDYFVGSGSKVAKKDIKEKFFAYDREDILLNAMISQLVTLGIIDDKCSDTYYKVLINRHDWKHILCDNIERKKLDAIKNEGLNAYNDYILNYFKNDNYSDFLQLKSVISGKYGEGVIENVFYKDNQLFLHIVFKNGHEGDFDVKTMFYGNDTIVEYDTISDYELVCHYGKILEDINVKITPEFADGVLHGSYSLTMNVKDYYDRNFENLPKLREIVNDCEKVYYEELMRDIAAEQEAESLMAEVTHMANEAAQGDDWEDYFRWNREKEEWVEKDDNLDF